MSGTAMRHCKIYAHALAMAPVHAHALAPSCKYMDIDLSLLPAVKSRRSDIQEAGRLEMV